MITVFLDHLVAAAPFVENGQQPPLSLCSWHACWLFNQSTRQPAIIAQLEPVLHSTCDFLLHRVRDRNMEHQACHLCAWVSEQEMQQVEKLQCQLRDPMQQVQLCLPHARAALRRAHDEETQRAVAHALMYAGSLLANRLEAYVHKCTERFQDQMQPDERVAWFDAIRWFGGSDVAQFLLTSSPPTETSGE